MNEMLSHTVTRTATAARGVRDDQPGPPTPGEDFGVRDPARKP
ncbi:hypothetical protein [Streptosporangium sp. CA-115845]